MARLLSKGKNLWSQARFALGQYVHFSREMKTVCRPLTIGDFNAVEKLHVNSFIEGEPMARLLRFDKEKEGSAWFQSVFNLFLKDGLSCGTIDSETGQLIAFLLCYVMRRSSPEDPGFVENNPHAGQIVAAYDVINILHKNVDLFEKYDVDKYVYGMSMSVDERFQRSGIVAELMTYWFDLAKDRGFSLAVGEATGNFSLKASEKVGGHAVAHLPYSEVTIDGKPVELPEDMKLHQKITLLVKQL